MSTVLLPTLTRSRSEILSKIHSKLLDDRKTLRDIIIEKCLYFRVSLVGNCNLSCPFCHNEGAPLNGKLDLTFATDAITAAAEVGFARVQFTGGEPLLHPQIDQFIVQAKKIVSDVGVTTNGTFLEKRIEGLVEAGITRIHISLQVESLVNAGKKDRWGVPRWLLPMLDYAAKEVFILRLNMPIPMDMFKPARDFLEEIAQCGCDLKVFSILPNESVQGIPYPLEGLVQLVDNENNRRYKTGQKGKVFLRGYAPPTGIRCQTCLDFRSCKEQSHSLRLGADHILRPCLATRLWDSLLVGQNMYQQIEEAALLAIDY